ncbi:MAG: FecR domain-containing protein [Puniceicoccales bacterium]|nr:FecR domain-containing protein [Puniceicoccales bacterium]
MLPVFAHGAAEGQVTFTNAVISEVINDVKIVDAKSLSARPALRNAQFYAPDMLRTGRKSRAQLLMKDGTVVRVGSNAVFSFDAEARTIRLENGTVIFHSPTGKGGGNIVTNSATASVIGTTIMVTATSNGGFKFSVLEGEGKVLYSDGKESRVQAGQMMFVMPKSEGGKDGESSEQSQEEDGGKGAAPGMVLNFDLATMVSESGLLNGFSSSISSAGKIASAISEQGAKIAGGDLQQTGMVILSAATSQDFYCADLATVLQQSVASDYNFALTQDDDMRVAANLNSDLYVDANNKIPERYIFRDPVVVDGDGWSFDDFTGVLADQVTFGSGTVDLSSVDGANHVGIGGSKIVFDGNIVLSGLNQTEILVVGGGEIVNTDGASLDVVFGGNGGSLNLVAEMTSTLDGMSISNNTGSMTFQVNSGDLIISNSALESQNTISGSTIKGDMTLVSSTGAVEINSSNVAAHGADLTISGATHVAIDGTALTGNTVGVSSENVSITNGSQVAGDSVSVAANDTVVIDSSHLASNAGELNVSGVIQVSIDNSTLDGVNTSISGGSVSIANGSQVTGDSVTVAANDTVVIDSSHLVSNAGELNISGVAQVSISNSTLEGIDALISGGIVDMANSTSIHGNSIVIKTENGLTIAGSDLVATQAISLSGGTGTISLSQTSLDAGQGTVSIDNNQGLVLDGAYIGGDTVTLASNGTVSSTGGTNISAISSGSISGTGVSLVDSSLSARNDFAIQAVDELLLERTSLSANNISLVSSVGGIELISANIQSANGNVDISALQDISISDSTLGVHRGELDIVSGGAVTVTRGTIKTGGGLSIQGNSVTIQGAASIPGSSDEIVLQGGGMDITAATTLAVNEARITDQSSSGDVISLKGNDVAVSQSTIQAAQANITITANHDLALTGTAITGNSLVLNAATNGGRITLDQVNLNVPMQVIKGTAETLAFSNVSFTDGTLATLYSGTGLFNSDGGIIVGQVNFLTGVTYAGNDALDYVYVPSLNIGDVESPIHILPIGGEDYRGSKVAYSLSRALEYVTVGGVEQISNNFVYRKVTMLTPEQVGVMVPSFVTALDPDLYKFCGVLAKSMTVDSSLMTSLQSIFNNADFTGLTIPTVKYYALNTTLAQSININVPTAISHVEIAGNTLSTPNNLFISANFSDSVGVNNELYLRTLNSLSLNNATITSTHGSLSIQSGGSLTMNGGTLTAGCADASHPNGHITLAAPLGAVILNNVAIAGKQNASRLTVVGANVQMTNTTLQTPATGAGYIAIQGAQAVSLQGGRLVAKDISIGGANIGGINTTLESLDVNGVQFGESTPGSVLGTDNATIAMSAKTIVIRNVNFNDGSKVALYSRDGALNVMGTEGSMFGAVNFGSGTVKYGDNDVTSGAGISQFVNVQGHGPSNSKIFFDKVSQQGINTAGPDAPIQIKPL